MSKKEDKTESAESETTESAEVAVSDGKIKWKKPNGNTIETNAEKATVEHCKSLGWEPVK